MIKIKNKEFIALCISVMLFYLSNSLLVPILPEFFSEKGMSTLLIGYAISAYGVSKSISQLPSGMLADLMGHKKY